MLYLSVALAVSAVTKVKTDWHSRLGEEEVECLIRIKKEGPPPGIVMQLLIKAAAERLLKARPRRGEIKQKSQLS